MSWSGRQRRWKLAVTPKWWRELKDCYRRLCQWLKETAPQLESQRHFLRRLAVETPLIRENGSVRLSWVQADEPLNSGV
jgi:hypothetical protein